MVSLEQVKLLESKVSKTIDFVKKVTEENSVLKQKLDSYQARIDELEALLQRFKEDQNKIEDGILAALDRLNQFEDALESKLSPDGKFSPENKPSDESGPSPENNNSAAGLLAAASQSAADKSAEQENPEPLPGEEEEPTPEPALGELDIF